MRALALFACALVGCGSPAAFQCVDDTSCAGTSAAALCTSSAPGGASYCALVDGSCRTGKRWDRSAASSLAGRCVAELSFAAAAHDATSAIFGALAVADLDEDGKLDVVAGRVVEQQNLVMWKGAGDGTLQRRTLDNVIGGSVGAIAVADLDGDAHLDLVVGVMLITDGFQLPENSWIEILRGAGDGTFTPWAKLSGGSDPHALAIADLDGDGRPDLAAATSHAAWVYRSDASAGFVTFAQLEQDDRPGNVVLANLDDDPLPDLAIPLDLTASGGVLKIYDGKGVGGFGADHSFAVGRVPAAVIAEDVDRDGKRDLVAISQQANDLEVLLRAPGTFGVPTSFAAGAGPRMLRAVDFNGDGHLDALLGSFDDAVSVLLGSGDGRFTAPATFRVTGWPIDLATGDLDGDGDADVVLLPHAGGLDVLLNTTSDP
jgi:hypothetical protein